MKRTSLKINTTCPDLSGNNNEQATCEFHKVKMWKNENKHNHQLISNFNNLCR